MEKTLVANPEILFQEDEEEALLFHPTTGEIKLLNASGAFIYRLIDGQHSRDDILKQLIEAFEVSDTIAVAKDLDEFLQEMFALSLVSEAQ